MPANSGGDNATLAALARKGFFCALTRRGLAPAPTICSPNAMSTLSASYLVALASQFGSLGAFLGGFAATILVTLVVLGSRSRPQTAAIVLSALAASGFIVSVVASSMLLALLNTAAPAEVARLPLTIPRMLMTLAFGVSTFALLGAIGCSGWLHSRVVGMTTSIISVLAAVLVLLLTVQVN